MKKVIKFVLILALVALVILQFIRPEKNNGGYETVMAFENETKPSLLLSNFIKDDSNVPGLRNSFNFG